MDAVNALLWATPVYWMRIVSPIVPEKFTTTGEAVVVFIDATRQRPQRIPDDIRARLEAREAA